MKRETFAKYLIGMNNSVLPYFFQILYKYLLTSQAQECGGAATTEGHFGVILTQQPGVLCAAESLRVTSLHSIFTYTTRNRRQSCLVVLCRKRKNIYILW